MQAQDPWNQNTQKHFLKKGTHCIAVQIHAARCLLSVTWLKLLYGSYVFPEEDQPELPVIATITTYTKTITAVPIKEKGIITKPSLHHI